MAESIFRNSGIKVIVFTRGKSRKLEIGGGTAHGRAPPPKERKMYSSSTRRDARTPSSCVMSKRRLSLELRQQRAFAGKGKSKNGQMVIVIEGHRKEAVDALKQEIRNVRHATLRLGRGGKTAMVMIQDIDALATQEDVLSALANVTGLTKDSIKVGNMREFFGGNQAVTVRLPLQHGIALAKRGWMKIGLNECMLKEQVDPILCYKCWKYGYRSSQCTGLDRSEKCMKCGGVGHAAKACQEERLYCLTCRTEGHATEANGCLEFQKALKT